MYSGRVEIRVFERAVLRSILDIVLEGQHGLDETGLRLLWNDYADYFTHI